MWHMHQPDYRDATSGKYQQPWTYLHSIKDYVDMAMHLEAHTNARVVVNFTPILIEQIDDYSQQIANYINKQVPIKDPLLSALASPSLDVDLSQRKEIINSCSRANETHIIKRFPAYKRLIKFSQKILHSPVTLKYLNDQYIHDLLVWYHLAWLAENVRRSDIRIKRLLKKEHDYNLHDRQELVAVVGELISSIIPRYRALAEMKQIELSTTPYAHPIVPLLLNLNSAKEAMPGVPMPRNTEYPGGLNRAQWHIEKSIEIFKQHFGFTPSGCWPSEGAISVETCELLQKYGFKWTASGAAVFWNSIRSIKAAKQLNLELSEHAPNRLENQEIVTFFRDDRISDLIGFEYSSWHADHAVENLIHNLKEISLIESEHPDRLVSIILDGENAWEHFPKNGYYFLNTLYEQLANHPDIELTTYSAFLEGNDIQPQILTKLIAGSWVHGTLSTWIGDKDKNRGWEMLCDAKQCFDEVISNNTLSAEQRNLAVRQLAICEGSDWFWWFGDYNSADSVSEFEKLFRNNLANLYKLLNQPVPEYLATSFTFGQGSPEGGGSMRRSG